MRSGVVFRFGIIGTKKYKEKYIMIMNKILTQR